MPIDSKGVVASRSAWLRDALGLAAGDTPFPWQERLLGAFVNGEIPTALDIPTGLGKTAVMAVWLVARACGAPVPRRLVYVVDRRAVVDQATSVAERLRTWAAQDADAKAALGLTGMLPVSTLRGQHVDNRAWLEDPAAPAIVLGTVDMIGSRLLFGGYGVSRKMRPYHAGLLGADALIVLDEAHLVPPFERLVEQVACGTGAGSCGETVHRHKSAR
jgi:CRISPR-associated endonuclease/helicase Cas3